MNVILNAFILYPDIIFSPFPNRFMHDWPLAEVADIDLFHAEP
jgi:hypothetical protein